MKTFKEFQEELVPIKKILDKIGKKIKNLRKLRPPYTLILGDEEVNNTQVSIRGLNNAQRNGIPVDEFITEILEEINTKDKTYSLTPK